CRKPTRLYAEPSTRHGNWRSTSAAMHDAALGVDQNRQVRVPIDDPGQHRREIACLAQPPSILERQRNVRENRPEARFLTFSEGGLALPPVETDVIDELPATNGHAGHAVKQPVRFE